VYILSTEFDLILIFGVLTPLSDLQVKLSALSDSSAETKSELEKQLSELSQKCQQFSEKCESEEHVSKQIFEEKQKEIDKLETNLN
jgi:septation ring formation regulator EzrA